MVAKSNVVVSEGQVTFKRVQGHNHDGLLSTLIDTKRYSIFDFTVTENAKDQDRASLQRNNQRMLKTFIIDTIEGRVLNPEGIRIQANAVTAREIVAGTITAAELSSNIVLVDNVIRSKNFINNTTTQTGWAIYSNGTGIFNNVNIRGNIYLSNTGGSSYSSSNTALYADINGRFSLKDKLTWDGNTLTIRGTLQFPDGSTPGTFDNGEALTAGTIGGITINNTDIRGNYSAGVSGFLIRANGDAEFNDVTIRGDLDAGTVGGLVIDGGNLVAGDVVADDEYGEYVQIEQSGQLLAYRKDFNYGFGEYYVKVDVMGAEPGIVVSGTANGSLNSTRILSSAIFTKTIFLNGTSIATSLSGKSNTGHNHDGDYAPTHSHPYLSTSGGTLTGLLIGTSIDMTSNIRYGGSVYSDAADGYAKFGAIGMPTTLGDFVFQVNQAESLFNRSFASQTGSRAVYINSNNALFTGSTISSERYKNSIKNADIDTSSFLKLNVVNFYYNDEFCEDPLNKEEELGIIAEQVDELGLTDLVRYDDIGRAEGLNEDKIPFYLLKTCIVQQAEIDDLKARIQALEGV
jgi:hypothetical protein